MSKVNDEDVFSVLPRLSKSQWPSSKDYDNYRKAAHRFADRFTMELNQIIVGKLSQEDRIEYYNLIKMNYDILLYILFKKESVEGTATLSEYRRSGGAINTGGAFPWFSPVYNYLKSKIPDIWEIGQTLSKDISNDFYI